MGNSTITLQSVYDAVVAKGVPDPRNAPAGYSDSLALEVGSETMADLICERFNWKFNRAVAAPFYTNSWQQDYPQPAQTAGPIGWGEDCDIVDINNTTIPKPLNWEGAITWRKQLTRTSLSRWRPRQISWMYNLDLSFGTWPGPHVVYSPLLTTGPISQNPIMNFVDANGNLLILTTFGTTGSVAPSLPANSVEGTTVTDGSVVWSVVSPTSQGFRLDTLPNASGPVYQIIPYYQLDPPVFTVLSQLLNPIPNSFSRHFYRGLEAGCYIASSNPQDKDRGRDAKISWLNAMVDMVKQGNREPDAYGLIPSSSPVESRWGWQGPITADHPYGTA